MFDEEKPGPKDQVILGEDLYDFSVADLSARILELEQEIIRTKGAREEKCKGLDDAAAIFGKS